MKIAIVAESYLPYVNGVSNSVEQVRRHMQAVGHEVLIIAPRRPGKKGRLDVQVEPGVVRVPSVQVPLINSLPMPLPTLAAARALRAFRPDVIHLASPFVLGAAGAWWARLLKVPAVAVFQTDVAGFAGQYRLGFLRRATWGWLRMIHNRATVTLAPSTPVIEQLRNRGFHNIEHWGRGVDLGLFGSQHRDEQLRRQWLAGHRGAGQPLIVGFVGRLAQEKNVHRLRVLAGHSDARVVIVGDGPDREALQEKLPEAVFTGSLRGEDLARAYASMDVFVHTGEFETFCQTIQEAQASGLPTVAPRAGGPIDLVKDGVNGFLLDVNDFEAQLVEVIGVLRDRDVRERMAANAVAGVQQRSWEVVCAELEQHYVNALGVGESGQVG